MPDFSWKKVDGAWAVRVWDGPHVTAGETVTVTTRGGRASEVTLGELLGEDRRTRLFAAMTQDELREQVDSATEVSVTEPGVYERADGVVFVVKPNRAKTALYAKRLVEINAERATEAEERVQIEFEYEAGAVFTLTPEDKMPLDRAKELTLRYGRCIVCGRGLKAAKSVEDGIGPVCIKSFRDWTTTPGQLDLESALPIEVS